MSRGGAGPVTHGKGTGVRIIGGRWRGTRLPVADAAGLRPTPDRTRETLFNWLAPVLPGARVLDLFAGTGVLGLEALSRGAAQALLVERDPALADAIESACTRLRAGDTARVVRADARAWLAAPLHGVFDVVFVDPPFAGAHWRPVAAALEPWVHARSWLYVESPLAVDAPPGPAWTPHRTGSTRETRYALYRRAAPAPVAAAADSNSDSHLDVGP